MAASLSPACSRRVGTGTETGTETKRGREWRHTRRAPSLSPSQLPWSGDGNGHGHGDRDGNGDGDGDRDRDGVGDAPPRDSGLPGTFLK